MFFHCMIQSIICIKNDHIIQDKRQKMYISIHIVNQYHTKSDVFFLNESAWLQM